MADGRITVLVENTVGRRGLFAEHGLSFWIEWNDRRTLFDTGQGSVLLGNARRLGARLERVDAIVLSHGHYDHTGGLGDALRSARGTTVYAHRAAFEPKYAQNPDGMPNIIYATCVGAFGDDRLVVADNYFDKTRRNLLADSKGALLFRSRQGKAYQVKGALEYHRQGPIFDHMKTWNPAKHPGHGAAALRVEAVYCGAEKIC